MAETTLRDEPGMLSIVIPAFREEHVIGGAVARLREFLDARGYRWELIVVDDGSRDQTARRASDAAPGDARVRVLRHPANRGKGQAVKTGVGAARGAYVGFMDADLSTALECVDQAVAALQAGAAAVIGSRRVRGARILVAQPLIRRAGSLFFRLAARTVVGLDGITDTQCGFKFFTADAARELFGLQTLGGYLFDLEILAIARRRGYIVREVPVTWSDRRGGRGNTLRLVHQTLRDLGRVRRRLATLPVREAGERSRDRV